MVKELQGTIAPCGFHPAPLRPGPRYRVLSPRRQPVTAEERFAAELVALRPRLLTRALKLCMGDQARAQDLVQTTCEKALRHRQRFHSGSRLEAWLSRIMKNQFLDEVRSVEAKVEKAGLRIEPGRELPAPAPESTDPLLASITVEQVRAAVDRLGPKQRLVFVEFHFNEKSYKEISEEHGLAMGSIAALLFRARTSVRTLLQREFEKRKP